MPSRECEWRKDKKGKYVMRKDKKIAKKPILATLPLVTFVISSESQHYCHLVISGI